MPEKKAVLDRKVPAFTLPSTSGKAWKLRRCGGPQAGGLFLSQGRHVRLHERGEAFRDLHAKFRKAGVDMSGISRDSLASHDKFRRSTRSRSTCWRTPTKNACALFDVIQEKSMYGRKYMGIERSTFLIDAQGVLRREWRKVKVAGHAEAVLEAASEL